MRDKHLCNVRTSSRINTMQVVVENAGNVKVGSCTV